MQKQFSFLNFHLTGYEPELAKKLATNQNDNRLDIFQEISDNNNIIIGLGLPTATESQIRISMIIFEPNKPSGRLIQNSNYILTNFHILKMVLDR
jgi:hypothetical protein